MPAARAPRGWMVYYHGADASTPATAAPLAAAAAARGARASRRLDGPDARDAAAAERARPGLAALFPEHAAALRGGDLAAAVALLRRHVALFACEEYGAARPARAVPVSYTHLTLPTKA